MHPTTCANWEYKDHKHCRRVLPDRCQALYRSCVRNSDLVNLYLWNTSKAHEFLFGGLTLPGEGYLAGNYRGSNWPCLLHRPVELSYVDQTGARQVVHRGHDPEIVNQSMVNLHGELLADLQEIEKAKLTIGTVLTKAQFLAFVSAISAEYLQLLFTIHPYANGNGHMGRFLVSLIFIKIGRRPKKWKLDSRPPYDNAVQMHRMGYPDDLTNFILKSLTG